MNQTSNDNASKTAQSFFNVFPVPQSLKNIKVIGQDDMDVPIVTESKVMYKTKSILSNDPVTNEVFN